MAAKGRGRRRAGDLADLLETQSAPDAGDDDFAELAGQLAESDGRVLAVELARIVRAEPALALCRRDRFAPSPSPLGPPIVVRPVPHDAVEPGSQVVGLPRLSRQLDERFLHDVSGRRRPLGGEQLQRSRVRID